MEKTRIYQTVLRESDSDSRKKRLFILSEVCLLLIVGLAVSMALLGESLGRFSGPEPDVISLIPPKDTRLETDPILRSKPEESGGASLEKADGAAGRSTGYWGKLNVFDDRQTWGSETQIDLFRASYDGTVTSGDGKKVVAPGTSNYYGFALKNNGNIPLDYTVSLKVETLTDGPAIPLEWRVLDGERTAVSDWQEYNNRKETLKKTTLAARRQDNYTIEWRWNFERGQDGTDTDLGNAATAQMMGAKATITVLAEQSADWEKPIGTWWLPQTGDTFNMALYLTMMAISGGGLVLLFVLVKRRKKDEDEEHGGKKT